MAFDIINSMEALTDKLGRPIHDLRISVTDRCNFRCTYCMPKEVFNSSYQFLRRSDLMSFEEIAYAANMFAQLGVKKLRLTGGEPLVRKHIERLVGKLAEIDEIEDLSLTTNGSLLTVEKAQALKAAGLSRITVSLDSLDDHRFMALNAVDFPVARVLEGIDNAAAAGLPVKINMVVKRDMNAQDILPMAKYFREQGHILRFIEYMDVGTVNGWQLQDVVPMREVVDTINKEMPIQPAEENYAGEVAKRWSYRDGSGEIGMISSVTQPFCQSCSRLRLSAEGKLYTCLFATDSYDLLRLLRQKADDEYILECLKRLWKQRTDRYSETRSAQTTKLNKVEMSYIGG